MGRIWMRSRQENGWSIKIQFLRTQIPNLGTLMWTTGLSRRRMFLTKCVSAGEVTEPNWLRWLERACERLWANVDSIIGFEALVTLQFRRDYFAKTA